MATLGFIAFASAIKRSSALYSFPIPPIPSTFSSLKRCLIIDPGPKLPSSSLDDVVVFGEIVAVVFVVFDCVLWFLIVLEGITMSADLVEL